MIDRPTMPVLSETLFEGVDNQMLAELQRFAELGRLSATLLHEISNPLTAAILYLDQYSDKSTASLREVQRNIRLLQRYVEAARQQLRQQSELTSFALRPQIEQLKRLLAPKARAAGVQLMISPIPGTRLYGDAVKFQQIVANLMANAIDAYGEASADGLSRPVHVQFDVSDKAVIIRVIDWGKGIAPSQLPLLFEPFYTTKMNAGYGLGIGLFLVKEYITRDFGGSIAVRSSRRSGTQFIVKLPLPS